MTDTPKKLAITDLFTKQELERAFKLIQGHHFVNACDDVLEPSQQHGKTVRIASLNDKLVDQVVMPALPRIDKLTGQENNALYYAYVLQYAYTQTQGKTP